MDAHACTLYFHHFIHVYNIGSKSDISAQYVNSLVVCYARSLKTKVEQEASWRRYLTIKQWTFILKAIILQGSQQQVAKNVSVRKERFLHSCLSSRKMIMILSQQNPSGPRKNGCLIGLYSVEYPLHPGNITTQPFFFQRKFLCLFFKSCFSFQQLNFPNTLKGDICHFPSQNWFKQSSSILNTASQLQKH